MKTKISKRATNLASSVLAEFFEKSNQLIRNGRNVIQLGIGDPDNETLGRIKKAGIEAIKNGETHYNPASGTEEIKEAILLRYDYCDNKVETSEVLVSGGSRIMLSAIFWALINPGDSVIIPSPYYPSFVRLAHDYGAKIIDANTEDDNFLLKAETIEKIIKNEKKKPKILIINSPNNPTGAVYEKDELVKINKLSKKYGFIIISDECYKFFSKDKFSFREISDQAIIIDSCSKEFFMTGWRIGWGVMPQEIARAVKKYLALHVSSFSSISEKAAIEALHGKGEEMYLEQRKIIFRWLKNNDLHSNHSSGGFYIFSDFSKYIKRFSNGSIGFANYILDDSLVALAPGIDFGNFDNYLRIAYCVKIEILQEALDRIQSSIEKIR